MNHHVIPSSLETLDEPELSAGSVAFWSNRPAESCVVFVHGFMGRPVATWGEFSQLAMESDAFADSDLFFIGYESRASRAIHSAAVVRQFLDRIGSHPEMLRKEVSGDTVAPFNYQSIVIIAHSLGAPVVRDAVMAAKREGETWAERVKLGLFAPAHLGADPVLLMKSTSGILNWLGALSIKSFAPVLEDLRKGSDYLNFILKSASDIGVHATTQAAFVVHVRNDRVVDPGVFFQDPQLIPYHDRSHTSCCKPERRNFLKPLDAVAKVLKR